MLVKQQTLLFLSELLNFLNLLKLSPINRNIHNRTRQDRVIRPVQFFDLGACSAPFQNGGEIQAFYYYCGVFLYSPNLGR